MVPYIAAGDHVLAARVKQPGITPKLINTRTRPSREVSKTGGHVYDVKDIVMERAREVQITRMRPYADALLNFAAELKKIFNSLKSQGEFGMERLEAVV